MLVWLASYPRSGNTFVRTILKECFNIRTQPLYGEGDNRVFATPELREAVGHTSIGLSHWALIDHARSSSEITVVKTHEPPLTNDKTIHIVRDGRSALISYFHYMKDVEGLDISLEKIIRGDVYSGSWSDHFLSWADRPNTLILRYEELSRDPNAEAEKISSFLEIPVLKPFTKSFSQLKALKPAFFRKGSDEANIAELKPFEGIFNECHSKIMLRLGY